MKTGRPMDTASFSWPMAGSLRGPQHKPAKPEFLLSEIAQAFPESGVERLPKTRLSPCKNSHIAIGQNGSISALRIPPVRGGPSPGWTLLTRTKGHFVVWDCTLQPKSETHADSRVDRETASGFRVLVADDQADVLEAIRLLLKGEGYELEMVNSPAALLAALSRRPFDLVLMDLNYARDTTSGREGLDLLSQIHEVDALLPIVAMTAWGSVELAVEIMREGVRDFVLKPWDNARLLRTVRTEIARGRLARKEQQIQAESRAREIARGDGDWQEAERTQLGFLPKEIPQIPGCEFSGAWLPVHGIGGDYFDVLQLGSENFAFCIADVAGKSEERRVGKEWRCRWWRDEERENKCY